MKIIQKSLFIIFALFAFGQTAWAQISPNLLPNEVKAEDAAITEMGHATMTVEVKIVTDSLTRHTDTLREMTNIEWHTERGTAKQRNAERERSDGSGFYNGDGNWWLDIYWYRFNYPSINAEGDPVLLSALACMPDEDCDYINNVIIGCHVTITSNKECPSQYNSWDNWKGDVSMLMNHAGSGLVFHSSQSDRAYYNLIILPDYEGYGITKSHAHPYLYQELTARQVVDGVRYGIALYKSSPTISSIRHPFRDGWRSICVGYSQGGSVAMATQRFIEQNGLTDELQLAGSVCGNVPTSNHKVLIEGQATIPSDCLAQAKEIVFDQGTITIADGGQLIYDKQGATVTMQKNIEAYNPDHTGLGNTDGWYFIATPFNGAYTPDEITLLSNTYDLYRLNNTVWENFRNTEGHPDFTTLSNGRGYLYANSGNITLQLVGELKPYSEEGTNNQVSVSAGWNLIGNPFACNVYADRVYYRMNATHTGIEAVDNYGANPIAPCTGVIVNAESAGNVTFSREAPAQTQSNNGNLRIALTQANTRDNALLDNAIVSFNEGSQLGKFFFGTQNANIYIPQGGKEYAIAFSESQGEMPLNFKAKVDGEYIMTVSSPLNFIYLHLIDNLTGADINLLQTPSYTFSANTTDNESRFKLVFNANENDNTCCKSTMARR